MVKIPLGNNEFAFVDDCDIDLLFLYSWHKHSRGYVRAMVDSKVRMLHCLIGQRMGIKLEVDHKNRNKLDCQRSNLREATRSQNMQNQKSRIELKGTYKHKNGNYVSSIQVDGKRLHLGCFDSAEEAHQAYVNASKKYFGEFARSA